MANNVPGGGLPTGLARSSSATSASAGIVKTEAVVAHSPGSQWHMNVTSDSNPSDYGAGSQGITTSAPSQASMNSNASSAAQQTQQHAVDKRRLHDLIIEVDQYQQVDEEAESCLLDIADDFIDTVLAAACQVAKHRKSPILEVKDVQYVLDTQYNLWMPGFGISDTKQAYKRPLPTDAHKQRMAIIRKLFKTH